MKLSIAAALSHQTKLLIMDEATSGLDPVVRNEILDLFQEFVQRDGEQKITYVLRREEGPDHDKTFYMEVIVAGKVLGEGSGKTKKDAEQHAAHEALKRLHAI